MTALTTHDASAVIGEHAFEIHQRIVDRCELIEASFLALGEDLYIFEREKLYLEFGHPSFNSYLADSVSIGRTWAYMIKAVYKRYLLELDMSSSLSELIEAGVKKLYRMRGYTTEANATHLVLQAATLSESDLFAGLDGTEPLDDLPDDTVICEYCHGKGRVPRARN